jgi:hypothetical protein
MVATDGNSILCMGYVITSAKTGDITHANNEIETSKGHSLHSYVTLRPRPG